MTNEVAVFLANGFEEIEAISTIDILRRAGLKVLTVSIETEKWVTGAHNINIKADSLFDEQFFTQTKMLVLPGGMPGTNNLNEHAGLKKLISEFYTQKKYIAAICAAPLILGQLNMLANKKATCYPGFEKELKNAQIQNSQAVVVDDNIITAKGVGAAIEFALQLVEILVNKETAEQLSKDLVIHK